MPKTERARSQSQADSECVKRWCGIERNSIDEENRTVEVSFSSEQPNQDRFFGPPTSLLHEAKSVDLRGIREIGSVLINHDADIESIVGSVRDASIDEKERKGRATIQFDTDDRSQLAFDKVKSGSLRGVSVRFSIAKSTIVEEKQTFKSPGGREFTGPLEVATQWTPREISLTPIPADTSVGVGRQDKTQETRQMEFSAETTKRLKARGWDQDAFATEAAAIAVLDKADADDAARAFNETHADDNEPAVGVANSDGNDPDAVRKTEKARMRELTEIAEQAGDPARAVKWFDEDIAPDAARREVLSEMQRGNPKPRGPEVEVSVDDGEKKREMIAASFLRQKGIKYEMPERFKDVQVLEGMTLSEGARMCLRSAGVQTEMLRNDEVFKRAFAHSSGHFPNILENIISKSMASGFVDAPTTYQQWTQRDDVPDFKQTSRAGLGEFQTFEEVPDLMPIPESEIKDKAEKNQLLTYGRKFSVGRQAMINDDLGAFTRVPQLFGAAAAVTINQAVYTHLVSGTGNNGPTMAEDSKQAFDATHASGSNHVASGGGLAQATLAAAKKLLRLMKGITSANLGDNRPLNLTPRHLLVGAEIEDTALQLIQGQFVPNTAGNVVTSDLRALNVIVEPFLDGAAGAATDWYLIANTALVDTVQVARLRGQQGPVMERISGHDVLGFSWVAYVDFGVKLVEHRGMIKNEV